MMRLSMWTKWASQYAIILGLSGLLPAASTKELGSVSSSNSAGMLYPRESESRQIQELNGMWNFRADNSESRDAGFKQNWFEKKLSQTGPVISMPVPSSYNDITTDKSLRDFVGWVWYDRQFFVSPDWKSKRIVLRIDSAHYNAIVWINGQQVVKHSGGHLPFEAVLNEQLSFDKVNRITIAVNNTLTPHTLPPGTIKYQHNTKRYPKGYFVQEIPFDFFNYAGIHRRVRLYTTPKTFIDDITIVTNFTGNKEYLATVQYKVVTSGKLALNGIKVTVRDKDDEPVAAAVSLQGSLTIHKAKLWWPYDMHADFGYQYTLQVHVTGADGFDVYRQPFGIRTIRHTEKQVLVNERPFYCHGVAKHEDSDIRGKGLDFPLIARDFNLLKWLGSNCFRTSHYPYAEEILDAADDQGIVIIDECPAVGLKTVENFKNQTLQHHLSVMNELIRRDKNRPSVLIWSVANEPASAMHIAGTYLKTVMEFTRKIDPARRPVTFVSDMDYRTDRAAHYTDIQCINRYYGWYSNTGHTEIIYLQLIDDLNGWYKKFRKPLMISEYGADTVSGMHTLPSFIFTEDYQVEFMSEYHRAFDVLRKDFLAGEMVWNFADFMTTENVNRVVGNKKGIFTRQRQPKMAAHYLRKRYWTMINSTLPNSFPNSNTFTKSMFYMHQNDIL